MRHACTDAGECCSQCAVPFKKRQTAKFCSQSERLESPNGAPTTSRVDILSYLQHHLLKRLNEVNPLNIPFAQPVVVGNEQVCVLCRCTGKLDGVRRSNRPVSADFQKRGSSAQIEKHYRRA